MGKRRDDQLDLFAADAPIDAGDEARLAELRGIASRISPLVRFGTSSWTFRGWEGLVYRRKYASEKAFVRDSLSEYAEHPLFRTVGIDRSYYVPVPRDELAHYAAQTPDDFVPVTKVWSEVATPAFANHPRNGVRAGQKNPRFLDAGLFVSEVLEPTRAAFGARPVPYVLEIPAAPLSPRELEKALDAFLGRVAGEARIAVELRRVEWLTPRHLDLLRAHGATHVFNYWERMPTLRTQLALPGVLEGSFCVVRLLIPPGRRYADEKERFAPFDRIVERQPGMRDDVVELVKRAVDRRIEVYVIANNKAEGCSPETIEEIARRLAMG